MTRATSLAFLTLSLTLSGCFGLRADLPGTLRADLQADDVEVLGDLDIEVTRPFFVFGLIGSTPPNAFAQEIARAAEASGADGVRALRIESTFTVSDLLIGCAGCGGAVVVTRTYRITGELVRIKKSPLPGSLRRAPDDRQKPTSLRF